MPIYTIFGTTDDAWLSAESATWSDVASGVGATVDSGTISGTLSIGRDWDTVPATDVHRAYFAYVAFDTSAVYENPVDAESAWVRLNHAISNSGASWVMRMNTNTLWDPNSGLPVAGDWDQNGGSNIASYTVPTGVVNFQTHRAHTISDPSTQLSLFGDFASFLFRHEDFENNVGAVSPWTGGSQYTEGDTVTAADAGGTTNDPALILTYETVAGTWEYIAKTAIAQVTSGSLTISEAGNSGLMENDLMVACIAYRSNAAFTKPTNWLDVDSENSGNTTANSTGSIASGRMDYIIRGASAPSLVWTRTGGDVARGKIFYYRAPPGSTITLDAAASVTMAANGTTVTLSGGVTTTQANALLVGMVAGARSGSVSNFDAATEPTTASGSLDPEGEVVPAEWSEREDASTTAGADVGHAVFDAVKSSGGSTGDITATHSADARHVMIVGAFVYSGADEAATASFTLTGQDVFSILGGAADAATFALTGNDAALLPGMSADLATFAYTANDVILVTPAEPASYTLTGQDAAFLTVTPLIADPAAFTFTANDALLVTNFFAAEYVLVGLDVEDLPGPGRDLIFLVDIYYHDGVSEDVYRLSTAPFTTAPSDTPPSVVYDPRVRDAGGFERSLGLDGDPSSVPGTVIVASGPPSSGASDITLYEWLDGRSFGRRNIIVKCLARDASSLSSAVTLLTGKIKTDGISGSTPQDELQIAIADQLGDANFPFLEEKFAGTTLSTGATVEGTQELEGKIKQQSFGVTFKVEAQPANPWDLIFLASNGPVEEILVYDGGFLLNNVGDYPSIAALYAATIGVGGDIEPGDYATCLATGHFRLGAEAEFNLVCDITEGDTAADRSAAQIVYRMLIAYGVAAANINDNSFDDLDADNNAVCGINVDDDRTLFSAANEVLKSIGARLITNRTGQYEVVRAIEEPVTAPTALTFDLDIYSLERPIELVSLLTPIWRVTLNYARNYLQQDRASLIGDPALLSEDERTELGKEWRTVTRSLPYLRDQYLDAGEIVIDTLLTEKADAEDECQRLLDYWSQSRALYRLTLPLKEGWRADLGGSVTVSQELLNMSAGQNCFIHGRADKFISETVVLDLISEGL